MLPISILPFPALRLDQNGVVVETNGELERELGLEPNALASRRFADCVAAQSRSDVLALLSAKAPHRRFAELSFDAPAPAQKRTFYVLRDPPDVWMIGQPFELDAQRDAIEKAHQRAEAQADEYARVSQELQQANAQLTQRAQQLKDATEAKARFLATMSHELRTPLNAVLGYAGLLRDGVYGAVSEQQTRAVQAIVRRAKDLQLLIDDVLDLSKIEAGRMELRVDEFDPAGVLYEVKDAITPLAREKELTVTVRTNVREHARLDRTKYKQILLNLATNAVKFTPKRGEVELSIEHEGPNRFVTRVRDTGIGIAPENLGRIFENFQQLDTGTTRRYQGLGLGLAIVRRMVELLSGTIRVESVPGRGTTFIVELPVRPEHEAIVGEPGTIPAEADLSGDPIVVAIDDDPEVIALLRDSLAPAHFRVVGALNGERGMELARILKPFAITLDIMMPEKDGWQVLREIKADAELAHIPVIIMSIVSERSLGFSLGVTDYLVKPVDRRVLIDVLERIRKRQPHHTALIVDDDYDARTLLQDLLGSLGFTTRACDSGAGCIEELQREVPEVLFVDVTMPEEEISQILDALSRDKRYEHTRTVIVTRSDASADHSDWLRRATAAVVYNEREEPAELLRELRTVLASIGAPAPA